ncbi:MAG: class I SAM-dependent methyltransferase [Cyclobacteriaceae bacterium]
MNDFNVIAPIYDRLAGFVFGDSIEKATSHFLSEIQANDKVLVLGGGTGKLLEIIPECGEIAFLDKSKSMITRARKRRCKNQVAFVREDFLQYRNASEWDVVICPFFLDCFDARHLRLAMEKITNSLTIGGRLIISDFQETRSLALFRFMHFFFRLFARLESKKLKNIHQHILEKGFTVEKEEFYHKKIIFSRVYRNL